MAARDSSCTTGGPGDDQRYSQAVALLAEAGADLERAAAIQDER